MTNSNPSLDPANNESLVGSISFAFKKLMQNINNMLPAQVISYDRVKNTVQVQILITVVATDGSQYPRPQVSIPVLLLGGGNFSISFPLNKGDLGWIMANDRDISIFLQTYSQAAPNTSRIKNFADGLFIPDVMRTHNITNDTKDYVLIQSNDGNSSISLGLNKNTSPSSYEVNIKADRINVTFNDEAIGVLAVVGNIIATGNIIPNGVILPYPVVV